MSMSSIFSQKRKKERCANASLFCKIKFLGCERNPFVSVMFVSCLSFRFFVSPSRRVNLLRSPECIHILFWDHFKTLERLGRYMLRDIYACGYGFFE